MRSLITLLMVLASGQAFGQDNLVPKADPKPSFLSFLQSRQTATELSLATATISADLFLTRKIVSSNTGYEQNVLAKPLVRSNGGAATLGLISVSSVVVGNGLLRNHPRWQHGLNWTVIGVESFFTARNAKRYIDHTNTLRPIY